MREKILSNWNDARAVSLRKRVRSHTKHYNVVLRAF